LAKVEDLSAAIKRREIKVGLAIRFMQAELVEGRICQE
jgi:hypothetical protein